MAHSGWGYNNHNPSIESSASTEKGGIVKPFSKSAKVACIWVKNADPSPMMPIIASNVQRAGCRPSWYNRR